MADIPANLWGALTGNGNFNVAGAANDLFNAGGSIASGFTGAAASRAAATAYTNAAQFTKEQTAMKTEQATREIYQVQSQAKAAAGGNGFMLSGSAGDIVRSNAQQGALTQAVIAQQGAAQESSYLQQAKEAKAAASGQTAGGILGALGAVASIFA